MLRNKIISLSLSFLMLICFCGCEAELTVEFDDPILEYKGNRYVDIDDEGRNLNVAWRIPDNTPSKEVNIFYGEKSEKDKTPNETGKAFKSEELNGWLLVEDLGVEDFKLYRRENLELPDYRDGDEIEKVVISVLTKTIEIEDPKEIEVLSESFVSAAIKANNHNKRSDKLAEFYRVELKYKGCGALFGYGELVEDADENWCLIAYDLNDDLIYQVDNAAAEILEKHGVDFSIFNE